MAENFDTLQALLKLLEPGCSPDDRSSLIRHFDAEEWQALIAEADRQNVAPMLYRVLIELESAKHFEIPPKEKLHQSYISVAAQNTLILHDTERLLLTLKKSGINVAGLKGIYLLEQVYGDIGARSMNDIDILIKKKYLASCITVLEGLGYKPTAYFSPKDENIDTKHVPPMQKAGGALVEVHWTLLEEDEPFAIDAEALWERMIPARIANADIVTLGVEDLVLHLCLHLTYQHYLQLGLRGLLDIALVIHKFRSEIDWQRLVQISKTWGSQRVTALTLKLVETQLNVNIPSGVYSSLIPEGIDPVLLEQARSQLLEQERFEDRLTPDLVEMNASKSIFAKIKIGLQRVFIPRLALARIYNVPPNSPRILALYWVRLNYLIRNYGGTLRKLLRGETTTAPALRKAEASYSLHEWMIRRGE